MPRLLKNSLSITARFALSLWIIVTALFILLYILPGDPVTAMLGASSDLASSEKLRQILGIDRPFLKRYMFFLQNLISFDWGVSLYTGQPVLASACKRFLITFSYALPASLVSIFLGYMLALFSHRTKSMLLKRVLTSITLVGSAFPVYFFALVAFWLARYIIPIPATLEKILLVLLLSIYPVAFLLHLFLNFLDAEALKPYITQLKSFRVKRFDLYWKIILKGAIGNILGSITPLFNIIIGNCFFIEYIFSVPGGCLWTVNAVVNYDFPVIYGATFLLALFYLSLSYVTKLLRTFLYGV